MELENLESDIRFLQMKLYELGKMSTQYSSGEILEVSEELDKKIILYQKLQQGIHT